MYQTIKISLLLAHEALVELQLVGFQVEFSSYIFRSLPVPIFLSRTLPCKLGLSKPEKTSKTTARDHTVKGGVISNVPDSILQSEIKKLNDSKAMPIGRSCLIVAKTPSNNMNSNNYKRSPALLFTFGGVSLCSDQLVET